ncbi:MAG: hypothetical protein AB3N18_05105 [Allomuricauda sp.]
MKLKTAFTIGLLIVFIISLSTSCNTASDSSYLFEELDDNHTNIHFKNVIPENEFTNSFVYEYIYNGGGVAIGDVNNDGLDDIYFTSNLGSN